VPPYFPVLSIKCLRQSLKDLSKVSGLLPLLGLHASIVASASLLIEALDWRSSLLLELLPPREQLGRP
jgi:hypothetical protein